MPKTILITSCSAGKHAPDGQFARLGDLPKDLSLPERVERWRDNLAALPVKGVPAESFYKGSHWQASVRTFEALKRHGGAELWVLSAGYGLVPRKGRLKPYHATFALGQADSVLCGVPTNERLAYLQGWWAALTKHKQEGPSSLCELMAQQPRDTNYWLVASEQYLRAVAWDLNQAEKAHLDDFTRQVSIFSAGSRQLYPPLLMDSLIKTPSRLAKVVGGAMVSLNARIALQVAEQGLASYDRDAVSTVLMGLVARIPPEAEAASRGVRFRSPNELEAAIRKHLTQGDSASSLLARFRRELGLSCSWERFVPHYEKIFSEVYGHEVEHV